MKKSKLTPQQRELVRHETEDPIDGYKAVGCLFSGIVILAGFFALGVWLISLLR